MQFYVAYVRVYRPVLMQKFPDELSLNLNDPIFLNGTPY